MPKFDDLIDKFCVGDDIEVRRTITRIPTGQTVSKAWLTIKTDIAHTDAEAVVQKEIDTNSVAGVGQIENTGGAGTAVLRFELTKTDTKLLAPGKSYYHDVQLLTSAGKISTPFRGKTAAKSQVTLAES